VGFIRVDVDARVSAAKAESLNLMDSHTHKTKESNSSISCWSKTLSSKASMRSPENARTVRSFHRIRWRRIARRRGEECAAAGWGRDDVRIAGESTASQTILLNSYVVTSPPCCCAFLAPPPRDIESRWKKSSRSSRRLEARPTPSPETTSHAVPLTASSSGVGRASSRREERLDFFHLDSMRRSQRQHQMKSRYNSISYHTRLRPRLRTRPSDALARGGRGSSRVSYHSHKVSPVERSHPDFHIP
jgi:hypothetical protein